MGYLFYIVSRKQISDSDFDTCMTMLSKFNQMGMAGHPPCDIERNSHYIRISGSYGISGKYVEGFVLNMVINLIELGYTPKVLSEDWGYGSKEDWDYFNALK